MIGEQKKCVLEQVYAEDKLIPEILQKLPLENLHMIQTKIKKC
jgi:hypothetical protein